MIFHIIKLYFLPKTLPTAEITVPHFKLVIEIEHYHLKPVSFNKTNI